MVQSRENITRCQQQGRNETLVVLISDRTLNCKSMLALCNVKKAIVISKAYLKNGKYPSGIGLDKLLLHICQDMCKIKNSVEDVDNENGEKEASTKKSEEGNDCIMHCDKEKERRREEEKKREIKVVKDEGAVGQQGFSLDT
eukprot:11700759-Ditylum_brightwellii.AAC.1